MSGCTSGGAELHSEPGSGRNFLLGKGEKSFGVPPSRFCVPSFDVLGESGFLRDKKEKKKEKKTFCSSRRRNYASPEVSRGLNIHSHIDPRAERKNQSRQKLIPDFNSGKKIK